MFSVFTYVTKLLKTNVKQVEKTGSKSDLLFLIYYVPKFTCITDTCPRNHCAKSQGHRVDVDGFLNKDQKLNKVRAV